MSNVAKNTVAYERKKEYIKKFNRENYANISFFVNKSKETDIINKLNEKPNKAGYIKQLIREDIKKSA